MTVQSAEASKLRDLLREIDTSSIGAFVEAYAVRVKIHSAFQAGRITVDEWRDLIEITSEMMKPFPAQ